MPRAVSYTDWVAAPRPAFPWLKDPSARFSGSTRITHCSRSAALLIYFRRRPAWTDYSAATDGELAPHWMGTRRQTQLRDHSRGNSISGLGGYLLFRTTGP